MTTAKSVIEFMKKNEIHFVDLRFTDPRGKLQHLTQHVTTMTEAAFKGGILFDGSAIAGWQAPHESDLVLLPDPDTAMVDPFYAEPTMTLFCDVFDPLTKKPYLHCPRSIAQKAEDYLVASGVGEVAYFGPETEFFLFDGVRFGTDPHNMFFQTGSLEHAGSAAQKQHEGHANKNHHRNKGGDFSVGPADTAQDLRTEMLSMMEQLGINIEKHHHEIATAQHKIGIQFAPLLQCADNMQLYKYVVHNVAQNYGKSATFMPKPIHGENGSGMHTHQSIWKKDKPLFAGKEYSGLSKTALYYIGGIIKHGRALNALTNPTTNSYKRLVPEFEAPVALAYAERNRSVSCRIPYVQNPMGKRVEVRFPDACANPYLAFAGMLMAGIDGIKNKIDPGKAIEKNLYDLPSKEFEKIPIVCETLEEAIVALEKDHAFLLKGDVFTKETIKSYLELKREEWDRLRMAPHPIEYDLYYSS